MDFTGQGGKSFLTYSAGAAVVVVVPSTSSVVDAVVSTVAVIFWVVIYSTLEMKCVVTNDSQFCEVSTWISTHLRSCLKL